VIDLSEATVATAPEFVPEQPSLRAGSPTGSSFASSEAVALETQTGRIDVVAENASHDSMSDGHAIVNDVVSKARREASRYPGSVRVHTQISA
jgi:hypothetical protein